MTTKDAVQKITSKIASIKKAPQQLAVFISKSRKSVDMTRAGSDLFDKAFAVRGRDLVGVYDARATPAMIEEDLRYVGFQG